MSSIKTKNISVNIPPYNPKTKHEYRTRQPILLNSSLHTSGNNIFHSPSSSNLDTLLDRDGHDFDVAVATRENRTSRAEEVSRSETCVALTIHTSGNYMHSSCFQGVSANFIPQIDS